jgi:hypothetical protein
MPVTDAVQCPSCQYHGPPLWIHAQVPWWLPVVACSGIGLVALLVQLGATGPACPRCGQAERLQPWAGPSDTDAQALHLAGRERDARAVRRTRRRAGWTMGLAAAIALAGLWTWLKA